MAYKQGKFSGTGHWNAKPAVLKTLREVGQEMGLTTKKVAELEARALQKMVSAQWLSSNGYVNINNEERKLLVALLDEFAAKVQQAADCEHTSRRVVKEDGNWDCDKQERDDCKAALVLLRDLRSKLSVQTSIDVPNEQRSPGKQRDSTMQSKTTGQWMIEDEQIEDESEGM